MKVRFLTTSDLHGYLMPVNYGNKMVSNYCLLNILETMKEYKKENTILIDNGDTIQGSPFLTYYYEHPSDNPVIECLKDYDYLNVGNHDFNYGGKELVDYLAASNGSCLCGNVFYKGKRIGKEYIIHRFDKDNSIALIGCSSECVLSYETKEHLLDIEVINAYQYCKDTIEKIKQKEKVKAIVIVYHGGFECDSNGVPTEKDTKENEGYRMCRDLDFDILISGHQHRSLASRYFNKTVSQVGANGKQFALIDLDLDTKESTVELIEPQGKYDLELYNKLLPIEKEVQKWLDEPIGRVENVNLKVEDAFMARKEKHPVISLINQAQLEATDALLSGTALFNGAIGFNKDITIRDLVSTYIYSNNLIKVKIDGKVLKQYLEANANYFALEDGKITVSEDYLKPVERHFNYDMVDGLDYTIKVSNPRGQRIIEMKYQGKDVKDDDQFSLAISNFRYGGSGGFEFLNDLEIIKSYDKDMVEVLMNFLKKEKITKVNHQNNIKVIL